MRSWMICCIAGVAAATWQSELIPFLGCISIALVIAALIYLKPIPWRIAIAAFLFGFLYASLWGHWQISHRLTSDYLRSDWVVSGSITALPQAKGDSSRFIISVDELEPISTTATSIPELRKVRLSWFKPTHQFQSGEKVRLKVRLKPPHGLVNPGGFDYERWLLVRGIDATGYVREFIAVEPAPAIGIAQWRQRINTQISKLHHEPRHTALFKALISGDKQALTPADWDQLRRSGTVHLAVISGLHIGFMAFMGWWLGRLAGLLNFRLSQKFPYLFSLLLSGGYMLIAGAELPTQRAFIMIAVLILSGWRLFVISHWQRWWLAMLTVVLFSPLALWETGFWLSFGAVAVLIWCGQLYRFGWKEGIKLQGLILFSMLPFYLIFFSAFSVVAPLVNLLAIPLVAILVPVEFINLLTDGMLIRLSYWLATSFWWLVDLASQGSWAYVEFRGMGSWSILMISIAALLMLLPRGVLPKPLVAVFLLPLLVQAEKPQSNGFSAWVYDVGQGLAVMVQTGDYRLLYDTGPAYRGGNSAFAWVLQPHWQKSGIGSLDLVVLSHDDNDHAGGYDALHKAIAVSRLYTSFQSQFSHQLCYSGQSWQVNGVHFRFLSGSVGDTDNDRSCVLEIAYAGCRLLLPGDISNSRENELPLTAPITWLVAAHHGSRTSTSSLFLQRTQPGTVIFSAGYANPFKHPHPDVVRRVENHGSEWLLTARDGAVHLEATATGECLTKSLRNEQKRFWRSFQSM